MWVDTKSWGSTDIIASPHEELNRIEGDAEYIEDGLSLFSNVRNAAKTLTCPISNGDFSGGTTGWTCSNSANAVSSGELNNTGNGAANYAVVYTNTNPFASCSIGDKFYVKMKVKLTNTAATNLYTQLYGGGAVGNTVAIVPSTAYNQYAILSGVITATAARTNLNLYIYHFYADAATQSGKVLIVDDVLVIPLTTVFGAGLEPTAAVMDDYMQAFPPNNWFGSSGVIYIPDYATPSQTYKTDWAITDYPTTAQAKNIDDNIKTFAQMYRLPFADRDWLGIVAADYRALNDWESTLAACYDLATDGITIRYCGTFNCGE